MPTTPSTTLKSSGTEAVAIAPIALDRQPVAPASNSLGDPALLTAFIAEAASRVIQMPSDNFPVPRYHGGHSTMVGV